MIAAVALLCLCAGAQASDATGSDIGSTDSGPFAELCKIKAADCNTMCKGIMKEQSCSAATGRWSCKCGVRKPDEDFGPGGDIGGAVKEPFKAMCLRKQAECNVMCKDSVSENSCSSTTGKWSCNCGVRKGSDVVPGGDIGGSAGATSWEKISISVASENLAKLIQAIDLTTWQIRKKITIGGRELHVGDVLLKEGDMAGKSITDLTSLASKSSTGIKLVVNHLVTKKTVVKEETSSMSKVKISIASQSTLKRLVESLTSDWVLKKSVKIGGITLNRGDSLLHEGTMLGKTSLEILKQLESATLLVNTQKLKTPTSRRRRRNFVITDKCATRQVSCQTKCGGAIGSFSCAFHTSLGTKYSCSCSSKSSGKTQQWEKLTTKISSANIKELLAAVDVETWTLLKEVKIGNWVLKVGDTILHDLDLKKEASITKLMERKEASIRILHRKTVLKREEKTDKSGITKVLVNATAEERIAVLEKIVTELTAKYSQCGCAKGSGPKVPTPRPSRRRRLSSGRRRRIFSL